MTQMTVTNVLKVVAEYGDFTKEKLIDLAMMTDHELKVTQLRKWARGELLVYVIEHYPVWDDSD